MKTATIFFSTFHESMKTAPARQFPQKLDQLEEIVFEIADHLWEKEIESELTMLLQTCTSVRLGHAMVRVDGRKAEHLTGRADILVSSKGKPIAFLELKREGVALTSADVQQGLSYARLMTPIAPLVVVSNGNDLWIYETYSGDAWAPTNATEQDHSPPDPATQISNRRRQAQTGSKIAMIATSTGAATETSTYSRPVNGRGGPSAHPKSPRDDATQD